MFPPGRANYRTIPLATGSRNVAMTMGIVWVACLAAWIEERDLTTSTSTLSCTSSATWLLSNPAFPHRSDNQLECFCPQYNRDLAVLAGMHRRTHGEWWEWGSPFAREIRLAEFSLAALRRVGRANRREQGGKSSNELILFHVFVSDRCKIDTQKLPVALVTLSPYCPLEHF